MTGGRPLQAVLLGGAAGSVRAAATSSTCRSRFEGARAAGVSLGSGVVMVFDDTVDLTDTVARMADFFRHESCGQCVPCRVGTSPSARVVVAPGAAAGRPARRARRGLRDASICGLGQTATSAVRAPSGPACGVTAEETP